MRLTRKEKKTFPHKRRSSRDRKSNSPRTYICPCCKTEVQFCWTCTCDFMICQVCMNENTWGMTCNHVTWTCPDCGKLRSY